MSDKIYIHPSWLEAITTTLSLIFNDGLLSDREIPKVLKKHPKWGSKDRKTVATALYDICRNYRKYDFQVKNGTNQENKDYEYWELIFQAYCRNYAIAIKNPEIFSPLLPESLPETDDPAILHSFNDALFEEGKSFLGEQWIQYVQWLNVPSKVYLRTNTLKTNTSKVIKSLSEQGFYVTEDPELEDCIVTENAPLLKQSKAFKASWFEFQDKGSQMIGKFCNVNDSMKVADVCAGLGGKTLQLSSLMKNKGWIVASDIDLNRLKKLKERAKSAGCNNIQTMEQEDLLQSSLQFDLILLDVPCSGTGTIKRQADIKWKFNKEQLTQLNEIQLGLLEKFSPMLAPEGAIIYATCSVLPQENEMIINKFIAQNENKWICEEQIRLLPQNTDGFFMARIIRNKKGVA